MLNSYVPELDLINANLYEVINDIEASAQNVCNYVLQRGGKRLRPALVILSARCFAEKITPQITATAVAAELVHLASLIHDDVLDNSNLRHGQPTLHHKWNNKTAILTGDILFSKAFQVLTKHKLHDIIDLMVEAITDMCSGEIKQALSNFEVEQEEADYYDRISKKTGKLIAVCCQAGALLGEAPEEKSFNLREYGLNLGYAFQIADDILDFTGESAQLGKPSWEDLKQGTITLPIITILKNHKYQSTIKSILEKKILSLEDKKIINNLLIASGALEKSKQIAKHFQDLACSHLKEIPDTMEKNILEKIASLAVNRCY